MPPRPAVKVTPWSHPSELVALKAALYNPVSDSSAEQQKRSAIETVRVWELRGRVPHAVVATAELTSALLFDAKSDAGVWERVGVYMSAWTRFIDGITDAQQIFRVKRNMFEIARAIGMPAAFVELRHRCVHERRPLLHEFRRAVRKGLEWLFGWFWDFLKIEDGGEKKRKRDEDREEDTKEATKDETVAFRERIERYFDERAQEMGGARKVRKDASEATESLVQYVKETCGDEHDRLRELARCIVADFCHLSPEVERKRTRGPKVEIQAAFPDELEHIALLLSQNVFSFAVVLNEVAMTIITIPTDEESDKVRDVSVALLARVYSHNDWQETTGVESLDADMVKELCLDNSNEWTKRLLGLLSTGVEPMST